MFSDETTFFVSGHVNQYHSENPHNTYKHVHGNMRCALIHDRVISSFFFSENMIIGTVHCNMIHFPTAIQIVHLYICPLML